MTATTLTEARRLFKNALEPETSDAPDSYGERILDAAYTQFSSYGIRRTALDDIARTARVGRMTLYRRYPRREDVISALILREVRAVIAKVERAIEACEDMHERIVEGFLVVVRDLAGHKLARRLLVSDPDILLPLLTIEAAPLITVGRQFLARQIELARGRKSDVAPLGAPEHVAELIARVVLSLLLTPASTFPLGDESALRELARRTIVPLIVGA